MEKRSAFHSENIHLPILLLDILKNGWLAILAAIAVCIGIFAYGHFQHQPVYATEATFVVSPRSNDASTGIYTSLHTASEMAGVFQEVFSSDLLKRLIREELQTPDIPYTISASVGEGTNILTIRVTSDSPENAHTVIQAVLQNYRRVSGYLYGNVVLDVLKKPQITVNAVNPFPLQSRMLLGGFLGAFGMLALIALLSVLRPTGKTLAGIKEQMTERPLGVLRRERLQRRLKKPLLITDAATSFQYTESLLQLAHTLRHHMKRNQQKVLLVTSVAENEGKSTVSANLALSLAQHGYRVAYVDMDLRKPAVHKIFSQFPRQDLLACLQEGAPVSLEGEKRLHIFSCNRPATGIDRLLHSQELADLLNMLRENMDFVILDTSPYTAAADTGMLLQQVDCCLMVMRQDYAPLPVCREVAEELGSGKVSYLGYVVNYYLDNGTAAAFHKHYGKYGYHKDPYAG